MNPVQPKIHSPLLLNVWLKKSKQAVFDPLDVMAVARIRLHDFVKVVVWHRVVPDFIWLEVFLRSATYWVGQVRSRTTMVEWIQPGDLVRFAPCNIYEVRKNSQDTV